MPLWCQFGTFIGFMKKQDNIRKLIFMDNKGNEFIDKKFY